MKALGGSYSKYLTCKQREKERAVWCSREIALSRQETGFFVHQKRVTNGFSLAVSFEHKRIRSISASSSAQTNDESEEIHALYSDKPKSVRVKFKLHKECAFGLQFIIVGDDPVVGLWDPSDGVPLIWSEGHVWNVEMDIPSGKVIKYKFILKGDKENISWQPGPDRILETWPTDKTITVSEDWDNAELQTLTEEEIVSDVKEEFLFDSHLLISADNLNQAIPANETEVINNELANANGRKDLAEQPFAPMVAENIIERQDLSSGDKGATNGSNLLSSNDVERIVLDEGVVPVLVPGLIPEEIEEAEVENESVEKIIDEIEDSTKPEVILTW